MQIPSLLVMKTPRVLPPRRCCSGQTCHPQNPVKIGVMFCLMNVLSAGGTSIQGTEELDPNAAAEKQQHQQILTQIKGRDVVAIELQYHRSCYEEFTRCLTATKAPTGTDYSLFSHGPSFKTFCEAVIEQTLIQNQEILRLTILNKHFIKTERNQQSMDA